MKYKLETVIEWIVMDLLWWAAAVSGTLYHHVQWFWTFAFLTWFLVLGWGLIALTKFGAAVTKIPFKSQDPSVPLKLALFSDLSLACLMAFTGHFFYAALVVLQMLFEQFYFTKEEVTPSGN
jgi:hypothetical protein